MNLFFNQSEVYYKTKKMRNLKLILTGTIPSKFYGNKVDYELLENDTISEVKERIVEKYSKDINNGKKKILKKQKIIF
jgi:uncharacterized protein YcfJ